MGWTQVIMTILALITLGTGVILNQKNTSPNVLSQADDINQTPKPIPTPSITSTPTIKPVTTPAPQQTDSNLSSLFYPGASVVSTSGNTAKLTSSSDPDEITSWYQEQFRNRNLNAISISKTNVNNNFLAKLAGANGNTNIEVEIKKSVGQSTVAIELKLTQ